MEYKIRKAVKSDCAQILKLVNALAHFEKAPDAVETTLAHYENTGFGTQPIWWAMVAEVAGEIQGFALYYIRFSTWKGSLLYLEDFYVNEAHRSLGLGKALFEATIQECKEKKYHGMVWQVLDWNKSAIDFYKKYDAKLDAEWINGSLNSAQINAL